MNFYQITETNVEYTKGYENNALIFIGNEKAILDFVNERLSEDDTEIDGINYGTEIKDVELAKKWLENNSYKIEEIKDFIKRLEKGEIIYIQ